ncbi:MAG: hypothetical protein ACOY0T_16530 [Myxococcota bacterium]
MLPKRRPSGHHVLLFLLALFVVGVAVVAGSFVLHALLEKRSVL